MEAMTVGQIKTHFSGILEKVKNGENVSILYGRAKKPVAMIVPFYRKEEKQERKIGILDGKVKIEFKDNFEMTTEELLGL
jgi:antitoxin (DNA-binding transcriptional repressor) of toxin-antitoxin stability system